MDIKQIRLQNLRSIILETGTIAKLARLSETAPAYLSQILNSLPTSTGKPRSVGDKLARKLELAVNKPYGWMDKDHSDAANQQTFLQVPMLDLKQTKMHLDHQPHHSKEFIPIPMLASERAFAIRLVDDSMSPKFQPGDIIVIEPESSPQVSDFVLAYISGVWLFRQLSDDGLQLLALNSLYAPVKLTGQNNIVGKIIYRGEIF